MSIGIPGFALAASAAANIGIWAVVPLIPLVWMGIGFGLCFASVLTKRLIGPRMSPRHPIPVFSSSYARWWLVRCCLYLLVAGITGPCDSFICVEF